MFYTKDVGSSGAVRTAVVREGHRGDADPAEAHHRSGDSTAAHYWWIECGGELDTVHENERIRDELWSVIYGIWDHIKNSGQFDAEPMTLEWVGSSRASGSTDGSSAIMS